MGYSFSATTGSFLEFRGVFPSKTNVVKTFLTFVSAYATSVVSFACRFTCFSCEKVRSEGSVSFGESTPF